MKKLNERYNEHRGYLVQKSMKEDVEEDLHQRQATKAKAEDNAVTDGQQQKSKEQREAKTDKDSSDEESDSDDESDDQDNNDNGDGGQDDNTKQHGKSDTHKQDDDAFLNFTAE